MSHEPDRIELEATGDCQPIASGTDRRPRMDQPLPVRLVAVGDVVLPARVEMENELDRFYVGMLAFVKCPTEPSSQVRIYRADNFLLRVVFRDGLIERDDYRPAVIEVLSLAQTEHKLIDAEIDYTRQKTVAVGEESLSLQDPSGNWIEIVERREVR